MKAKQTELEKLSSYLLKKYGLLLSPQQVYFETGVKTNTLAKWRCIKTNLTYTKLGTGKGSGIGYPVESVAEFIFRNMVHVNVT